MTKEEYLELASKHWDSFKELKTETNFYDYEKKFDLLMVNFGQSLLNKELSGKGKDRRQKKSKNPLR